MCDNPNEKTTDLKSTAEQISDKAKQPNKSCLIFKFFSIINTFLYNLHLYNTKGEALFKLAAFFISWYVGVCLQSVPVSYFLFSASIIMEYAIKLVTTHKFVPKILPLILVMSNVVICAVSAGQTFHKIDVVSGQECWERITMIIIFADTLCALIFEPPESSKIESNIAKRG